LGEEKICGSGIAQERVEAVMELNIVDEKKPEGRALWAMRAETAEGDQILRDARRLACSREYCMLSDAELIRKATPGEIDPRAELYK
jgi:hypothetical protein